MRTSVLACLLLASLTGIAAAQMPPPADTPIPNDPAPPPPPPEPAPPPPAPPPTSTATSPAPATTPSQSDGAPLGSAIGVGVHAMLSGPVGPAIVYNGGRFHVEGILAFADLDMSNVMAIAGRGWFHVHESPNASLSVGGGIGFMNAETETGVPGSTVDASVTVIEGGAQVRFFITRNVALSAALGISIVTGDDTDSDAIAISGQLTGGLGITYFIF